ncbi:hypothetical protein ATCC90586_010841 [Pythium insidiosum]|nr:hypothetical protein ATCC90586_010841 [Pythium insidiosum]
MKTLTIAASFVFAAITGFASGLSEAQNAAAIAESSNFNLQLLDAVNAERAKNGLAPLCSNAKLQRAAQLHSEDQAKNNFMSHTGSGGSTMQTRVAAQGFQWQSLAENVAAGQRDVASVMAAWMRSSGHRRNILGNHKFFGGGYAQSSSSRFKHYWTQNFGSGSKESCDGAPGPAPQPSSSPSPTPSPTNSSAPTISPAPVPTTMRPTPPPAPIPSPTRAPTPAPTPAPTQAPAPPSNSLQQRMLDAVNAERAKAGLAPFCTNSKLQRAAQLHSEDQAQNNFMSHTGSDGSSMSDRITRQQFQWNSVAENVAAGQVDVASVMQSWMNSDGHRRNILGNYKFFGMGYATNPSSTYTHYWTQNFGTGSTEACA